MPASPEDLAKVDDLSSCDDHSKPEDGCKECWRAGAFYDNERFYYWGPFGEPPGTRD